MRKKCVPEASRGKRPLPEVTQDHLAPESTPHPPPWVASRAFQCWHTLDSTRQGIIAFVLPKEMTQKEAYFASSAPLKSWAKSWQQAAPPASSIQPLVSGLPAQPWPWHQAAQPELWPPGCLFSTPKPRRLHPLLVSVMYSLPSSIHLHPPFPAWRETWDRGREDMEGKSLAFLACYQRWCPWHRGASFWRLHCKSSMVILSPLLVRGEGLEFGRVKGQ